MSWWWVLAGIILCLFIFRRAKRSRAFSLIDDAKPWFDLCGLDFESASFSVHNGAPVRHKGAVPIVGITRGVDGHVGFVIEVLPGKGVVCGELISTRSVMRAKQRVMQMRLGGVSTPLIDALA